MRFKWPPKQRACCEQHGFTLLALETDEDHVHCFVSAPPKDSPAKIVGLLKGYSSRMVRQQFPALARKPAKSSFDVLSGLKAEDSFTVH